MADAAQHVGAANNNGNVAFAAVAHNLAPLQGAASASPARPTGASAYDTGEPAWSESYRRCTIIVARIANLKRRYPLLTPTDEMQFLHLIKEKLDNSTMQHNEVVWKLHTFQLPYYGMCISEAAAPLHADMAVTKALGLKTAVASVRWCSLVLPVPHDALLHVEATPGGASSASWNLCPV